MGRRSDVTDQLNIETRSSMPRPFIGGYLGKYKIYTGYMRTIYGL